MLNSTQTPDSPSTLTSSAPTALADALIADIVALTPPLEAATRLFAALSCPPLSAVRSIDEVLDINIVTAKRNSDFDALLWASLRCVCSSPQLSLALQPNQRPFTPRSNSKFPANAVQSTSSLRGDCHRSAGALAVCHVLSLRLAKLASSLPSSGPPSAVPQSVLDGVIPLCLDALIPCKSQQTQSIQILRVLGTLLLDNGTSLVKMHPLLLSTLVPMSQSPDPELRRLAITCLANLCSKTGAKFVALHKEVLDVALANMGHADLKVVNSSLRAMNLLALDNRTLIIPHLPTLITAIQSHLLRAIPSKSVLVSTLAQGVPRPPSPSRRLVRSWSTSSDSELSDNDSKSNVYTSTTPLHIRLQYNALTLLATIANAFPKQFSSFWNKFIPELPPSSSTSGFYDPKSLLGLLFNVSPKIRLATVHVLQNMLTNSKNYLAIASDGSNDGKAKSFLSFSEKLALQIHALHGGLVRAIESEQLSSIRAELVQTLALLVRNTTYGRLRVKWRIDIFDNIVKYLFGLDSEGSEECLTPNVIVAVLDCLCALVDTDAIEDHKGLERLIFRPATVPHSPDSVLDLVWRWALSATEFNSIPNTQPTTALIHYTVKVAAMEFLCFVVRFFLSRLLATRLDANGIVRILDVNANDSIEEIKSVSLKLLEQYLHSLNFMDPAPSHVSFVSYLDNYITPSLTHKSPLVRSHSLNCLSNLTPHLSYFSTNRITFCFSVILGLANDETEVEMVRIAAFRTLGLFVKLPLLTTNKTYLEDVISSILETVNSRDAGLSVRVKAGWALGNLMDGLVEMPQGPEKLLTDEQARDLLKASLISAKDNDKCKSNAMRAIGGLLRLASREFSFRQRESLVKDSIMALIKNVETGPVKVRWNAAHALSNCFQNDDLPLGRDASWTEAVYTCLCEAMKTSKNFKVRIHSCVALRGPKRAEMYDVVDGGPSMLGQLLLGVIEAWKTADRLEDIGFTEFKYREQLRSQLVSTFQHLETFTTQRDAHIEEFSRLLKDLVVSAQTDGESGEPKEQGDED